MTTAGRSLWWRIAWPMTLTMLGLVIVTAWSTSRMVRGIAVERTMAKLDATLSGLHTAEGASAADWTTLAQRVATNVTPMRLTVVASDGSVLYDSHADAADLEDHRFRPEIQDALQDGRGQSVRYSQTVRDRLIYVARRVDGSEPVVLRASVAAAGVMTAGRRAGWFVAAGGGVIILAVLAILGWHLRRLGYEVDEMTSGAVRFADHELDYRVELPHESALARTAAAFNEMARRLGHRIQQLNIRQQERQMILQSMSNAVIAVDAQQRIMIMNRAAENMLGTSEQSARGRLLQEVIREPALHRLVDRALEKSIALSAEIHLHHREPRTVQAQAEPMASAEDEDPGLLVLLNDVTHIRKLETLRSDFAANVSHELRTPITNVRGYVETLQEVGWTDEDQAQRFLEIVRKNINRLSAIVEDLMTLTKIESPDAREMLEREKCAIANIVGASASQFQEAAAAKQIKLRTRVDDGLSASVNAHLIEQALNNLISNAIRYSPNRTTVLVSGTAVNGDLELAVADEGPGIAPEHVNRLFERFYRVDKARSRELGGTGLGLAIVKHIANVHGGRIEVDSEVGRGSTFRLVVPRGDRPKEVS